MQESRPFLQHYAMNPYFSALILKGLWEGPEPVDGADTFVHCVYPASALTSCHQPRMFSREPQVSRAEVLERRRDERAPDPGAAADEAQAAADVGHHREEMLGDFARPLARGHLRRAIGLGAGEELLGLPDLPARAVQVLLAELLGDGGSKIADCPFIEGGNCGESDVELDSRTSGYLRSGTSANGHCCRLRSASANRRRNFCKKDDFTIVGANSISRGTGRRWLVSREQELVVRSVSPCLDLSADIHVMPWTSR